MAGIHRKVPLGLSDESPPPGGIAPGAGHRFPGPLTVLSPAAAGDDGSVVQPSTAGREESLSAPPIATFTLGSDTYRVYRASEAGATNPGEQPVPPDEAKRIIDAAVRQRGQDPVVVSQLKTAASQLGAPGQSGELILAKLRPRMLAAAVEAPPPADVPPPKPARAPSPPPPPPPVLEPVISEAIGAAQAATLKMATTSGVPFCEECAKAAAAAKQAAATA